MVCEKNHESAKDATRGHEPTLPAAMPLIRRCLTSIWTERAVRLALAGLFLVAGIIKLSDVRAFATVIKAFGHLPPDLVDPTAVALPILEIAASLALVLGRRIGLHALTALLALFVAVVVDAIRSGLAIDCGCYGPGDPEGEVFHGLWTTLYRDLAMLAGAAYLYAWSWVRGRGVPQAETGRQTKSPIETEGRQCAR